MNWADLPLDARPYYARFDAPAYPKIWTVLVVTKTGECLQQVPALTAPEALAAARAVPNVLQAITAMPPGWNY